MTWRVRITALPGDGRALARAAMALARALEITFAEASRLLDEPRVLPAALGAEEAAQLRDALAAASVPAESFAVAAEGFARCIDHPRLSTDGECDECRRVVCLVCRLTHDSRCHRCHARAGRVRRRKRLRVGVLAAALLVVAGWALGVHHRRAERTRWRHPLDVAVVLVATRELAPVTVEAWQHELPLLEEWIAGERTRAGGPLVRGSAGSAPADGGSFAMRSPIRLQLASAVRVDHLPAYLPSDDELVTRARHAWSLSRQLSAIDRLAATPPSDVRIYVLLEANAAAPTVEGAGEAGGDVGFVQATVDDDPSFALIAVAHELFHCLGATDKYDGDGHAREPDGLVEPERGYPQAFAEIMVGEIPLARGRGRTPNSLAQVRVGAATAAELHWR